MNFSFIVPVYNTGHLLEKCVTSIIENNASSYEIIIINDGSTDDSLATAERLAARYPVIRIVNQENRGQGAARNSGIALAKGDYIWFVDSDDWLFSGATARIGSIIAKHLPDVVVLNFATVTEDGQTRPVSTVNQQFVGQICRPSLDQNLFASVSCWTAPPWRLVCRRDLLLKEGIVFAEGLFYEDHPFAIHLMLVAENVFIAPSISYAYFQRSGSTTQLNDRKAFDFLSIRRISIELLERFGKFNEFANVTAGYISPLNFYEAHVPEPFRKKFMTDLGKDIRVEEMALLEQLEYPSLLEFARKAVAGEELNPISPSSDRLKIVGKSLGSREGRRRIRHAVVRRLATIVRRLSSKLHSAGRDIKQVIATGHLQRSYYRVGIGTRLEHTRVEVRVSPEDRDYLLVGNHSHVGGVYVFERGVGTVTIGDYSSVGHGTTMICTQPDGIHIGNQVLISWDVTIVDNNSHPLDPELRAGDAYDWLAGVEAGRQGIFKDWQNVTSAPVRIEDRAWVGFGVSIMKGVTIGEGAVVAAKSVVTKDVAPFTVVGGNPARFISYVPRQKWNWEETLAAIHGDPAMDATLRESYIFKDHGVSLEKYIASEEFREISALIDARYQRPVDLFDVGAGNGVCAAAFAIAGHQAMAIEPGNSNIGGIEAIVAMAEAGTRIDQTIKERLRWAQADILTYSSDEKYDVVLCRQALHHFADPYLALNNIANLLKPGGMALFVREHVIFDEEDKQLFLAGHPLQKFYGGENAYRVDEYEDFIEKSGLQLTKTLKFADSPINYEPHKLADIETLSERDIAGRPYTFIALKSPEQ